jgi:hypothetical protein
MKKFLSASVLGLALIAGVALPAFAASTGTFSISKTGVAFNTGKYSWLAIKGCSGDSEGFTYSGSLKDTAADGNAVFVHAKVDGYGYAPRIYNSSGSGSSKAIAQTNIHATGSVCYHTSGNVEACQDRGTLFPDICGSKSFTR